MRGTKASGRITRYALAVVVLAGVWVCRTENPTAAAFPGTNGRIVFASDRVTAGDPEGEFEIFTMDPDGTRVTRLTFNDALDADPRWSADGKRSRSRAAGTGTARSTP